MDELLVTGGQPETVTEYRREIDALLRQAGYLQSAMAVDRQDIKRLREESRECEAHTDEVLDRVERIHGSLRVGNLEKVEAAP